jgi:predicted DNA-binding transcriptional regulator YafY
MAPSLEKLRRAVRELRQVQMVYRGNSQSSEPAPRSLDPYALVHRWGWWYVVGHCHQRQEVRTFRVDRIQSLTLTGQVFSVPPDFDIHAFLDAQFKEQPGVRVRMRFQPQAAHVALANRSYWEELEEQPDGSVLVTFQSPDLNWAASSVISYGPIVSVLSPPDLRRLLADWCRTIAEEYQSVDTDQQQSS